MPHIEKAGYDICLTVHDEVISETPDTDDYNSETLAEIMSTTHEWAEGLPLAAAGFETYRYRKD
jgi:DNA polymerase